ncbi:MAG: DUF488 domain-containing protein [bacterium]
MIKTKSIHATPAQEDGRRYLIDLFWPEGVRTHLAHIDEWLKDLGPSYDLQRFEFDKNMWAAYAEKYKYEVLHSDGKKELLRKLAQEAKEDTITLLYGNKDPRHNHAVILKNLIETQSV